LRYDTRLLSFVGASPPTTNTSRFFLKLTTSPLTPSASQAKFFFGTSFFLSVPQKHPLVVILIIRSCPISFLFFPLCCLSSRSGFQVFVLFLCLLLPFFLFPSLFSLQHYLSICASIRFPSLFCLLSWSFFCFFLDTTLGDPFTFIFFCHNCFFFIFLVSYDTMVVVPPPPPNGRLSFPWW